MKILVVGGGGREHAIIKKLKENKTVGKIYALPGNGGIAEDAECVAIGACEIEKIVDFAREKNVDFAVVAPDDPLVLGLVDRLEAAGIPCFGPRANAAIIEGSKVFSKNLMKKYGIPTAEYETFNDPNKALEYVQTCKIPTVVKADGLALGKGVIIAMTREEAVDAVKSIMLNKQFGASGDQIVIEEFMEGGEASLLAFTDGKTVVPMIASQDHKRVGDGDQGPNTGGMGTYAPAPVMTPELRQKAYDTILKPMIDAMAKEGKPYQGCLYAGLMVKGDSVKVVEFNCRFGDPETQVVLPLLDGDLAAIMLACANGTLDQVKIDWHKRAAVCVVMASAGYPGSYAKGKEITGLTDVPENSVVFHAGTKLVDDKIVTNGGRVLGVTAFADDIKAARDKAYEAVEKISFEGAFCRKDIAWRALNR